MVERQSYVRLRRRGGVDMAFECDKAITQHKAADNTAGLQRGTTANTACPA